MIQEQKRSLFLQLLLQSYLPKAAEGLWKKLPLKEKELLPYKPSCNPAAPLLANFEYLKKIHYSWIALYLKDLPKALQLKSAALFTDPSKILKLLDLFETLPLHKEGDTEEETQIPLISSYLTKLLVEKIGLANRLPICFLPKSPFEELLKWDKKAILSLIDLLPLTDADKEIKQIVDRNKLVVIYAALTEDQKNYLRHCMLVKHSSCDTRLHLKKWQGSKEDLRLYFHKIGLELFLKGLHGEHPDFIFYLSHLLDTGRGKPLLSHLEETKNDPKKDLYFKNLLFATQFTLQQKNRSS